MSCIQNKIVKGRGNEVALKFEFKPPFRQLGLNNFTKIEVEIDGTTYDTDGPEVTIITAKELHFSIGVDTQLDIGEYEITVTGFNPKYSNGYELASNAICRLGKVVVV